MMKKSLIVLFVFAFSAELWAQTEEYPVATEKMMPESKQKINNEIHLFSENGRYGYRKKDSIVIEPLYEKIEQPFAGLMVAKKSGFFGAVDSSGQIKIPFTFLHLSRPNSKKFKVLLAARKRNEGFGLVDFTGAEIVPFEWKAAKWNTDSLLYLSKDGTQKIINFRGETVLETHYDLWALDGFSVDRTRFIQTQFNGKWGLISPQNKVLVPFEYGFVHWAKNNMAGVVRDQKWGVVHFDGRTVIPLTYRWVEAPDQYGFLKLQTEEGFGIADTTGKIIIPARYSDVSTVHDAPFFKVQNNNMAWSLFDLKGNQLTDFSFQDLTGNHHLPLLVVARLPSEKWCLLRPTGERIGTDELDSYVLFMTAVYGTQNNKGAFFGPDGRRVTDYKFTFGTGFNEQSALDAAYKNIVLPEGRTLLGRGKREDGSRVWVDSEGGEWPAN